MRRVLTAALASAAVLSGAVAASAQETFVREGETAEGVPVELELSSFGNATAFTVGKVKVRCDEGGRLRTNKTAYDDFTSSDPGEFHLRIRTTSRDGNFKLKTVTRASGTWDPEANERWSGSLRQRTRVVKNGRRIDTCRLTTTWKAS